MNVHRVLILSAFAMKSKFFCNGTQNYYLEVVMTNENDFSQYEKMYKELNAREKSIWIPKEGSATYVVGNG